MLEIVRAHWSLFGKIDERVLEAMDKVDRKYFVKKPEWAYLNSAISIDRGQTISQPFTVARMLGLLELKKKDNVLEVGAGSGWNACLIAYLVNPGKVLSLEFHQELIGFAKKNIKKVGLKNVKIKKHDFRKLKQKFNKIIFTAGIKIKEEKIILDFAKKHLKDKGILICPHRFGPLIIIEKNKDGLSRKYTSEEYVFVPLVL